MRCISRYTDDTYSQKFGNGHNKFYVEMRCNLPCKDEVCNKCIKKTDTKVQHVRTFNHGKINEPIPDNSHIFGSKWYHDSVKKYKTPSADVIAFAEKYRLDARDNVEGEVEGKVEGKVEVEVEVERKVEVEVEQKVEVKDKKPKRIKPKIAPDLVYKDVTLPTHLETTLEELEELDGFSVEYIKLIPFEHNGTRYFKDNKNKLYKNVKDKIGAYVGKLYENSILNLPDSDDET